MKPTEATPLLSDALIETVKELPGTRDAGRTLPETNVGPELPFEGLLGIGVGDAVFSGNVKFETCVVGVAVFVGEVTFERCVVGVAVFVGEVTFERCVVGVAVFVGEIPLKRCVVGDALFNCADVFDDPAACVVPTTVGLIVGSLVELGTDVKI